MIFEMKKNDEGQGPKLFIPTYAAFTVYLMWENEILKIFAVKSKKSPSYPCGFSGGKEELVDKKDVSATRIREHFEETRLESHDPAEFLLKITRKNNQIEMVKSEIFNISIEPFINYFFYCFENADPEIRPKLLPKESVEALGYFTLSEFDSLLLKQSHRIAFFELCYVLEEKFINNSFLQEELKKCMYLFFERPSLVGNVLMYKFDNRSQTSESSEKILPYLFDKKLWEGLRIFSNPKG